MGKISKSIIERVIHLRIKRASLQERAELAFDQGYVAKSIALENLVLANSREIQNLVRLYDYQK